MLLSLNNATKIFADRMIFRNVILKLEEGDRVGLVGANGAGKSTLLNVLAGDLALDEGERAAKRELAIGFLHQNSGVDSGKTIHQEMLSVFALLLDEQREFKRLAAGMTALHDHESDEYRFLAERDGMRETHFSDNDGYNIDIKIKTVLGGMGFADRDPETICGTLSGGEKTRLALAKLLLAGPELLMLDEPTNHLDFKTLRWLEEYLLGYKGSIVTVSHDRYFLDRICTRIWELDRLRFTSYRGNYTKYTHTREMTYQRELREYEEQQQNIIKLTDYIAKNKARASTAGMARSREKQLERVEVVRRPPPPLFPVRLAFRFENDPVNDVLAVEELSLRAGGLLDEKRLCENVDFFLKRGDKVAIVGDNGVGKTTFLKALMLKLPTEAGYIRWGKNTHLSYFEQEQTGLNGHKTILQEIHDRFPSTYEQDVRNALACMKFTGDDIYKKVSALSGGEKARLKFVIMTYEGGNVLLLDEPTNHLDIQTREVLDRALIEYEGTIVTVSHDRYLLARMPNRIAETTSGGFTFYEGGYEEYLSAKGGEGANPAAGVPEGARAAGAFRAGRSESRTRAETESADGRDFSAAGGDGHPQNHYRSKKDRARQLAEQQRMRETELAISELELREATLQEQLGDPEKSSDFNYVTDVCAQLAENREKLSELMEIWVELSETVQAPQ